MILNEDYFDDLEIKDEDIMADDTPLDVEEPEHEELTLEKVKKIPEQYGHYIRIDIDKIDGDTTFIQTSLLPKIFKSLDTILEFYGIEHSEYILTMIYDVKRCETVVKFGDYQLFCSKSDKDEFINNTYKRFQIQVYLNYPKFNYKRAFRFLYTVLNLYKYYKQIAWMSFTPITDSLYKFDLHAAWMRKPNIEKGDDIELRFLIESNYIGFYYFDIRTYKKGVEINLSNELSEYHKRYFYKSVFRHFFKEEVKVPYKLIDRYVPIKPLRPR